jgi:hypothetical protein
MQKKELQFFKEVLRKIHCYCIHGSIYNLKKVYSLYYFHPHSIWHGTWILNSNINALFIVNLSTKRHHLECIET